MQLFSGYTNGYGSSKRQTGPSRFTELLERDFKKLYLANLLTLLLFLPYLIGVTIAILSSSVLMLLPACIIGGALSGPAIACMYDASLRSLRDAGGNFFDNYRRSWNQNARSSILPGIIFCTFLGFYLFMGALFLWAVTAPAPGTVLVYISGILFVFLVMTVYWPLLVLFEQPTRDRLRNCLLFAIRYFWKTLGCALLSIAYWTVFLLFLPQSAFVLLLTGFWFIIFLCCFLLYPSLDEAFSIENAIAKTFPDQAPFYEDDET